MHVTISYQVQFLGAGFVNSRIAECSQSPPLFASLGMYSEPGCLSSILVGASALVFRQIVTGFLWPNPKEVFVPSLMREMRG